MALQTTLRYSRARNHIDSMSGPTIGWGPMEAKFPALQNMFLFLQRTLLGLP